MKAKNEREKITFRVPGDQRVRLRRSEHLSIMWAYNLVSTETSMMKELSDRLDMIPDGRKRMEEALEMISSVIGDITETVPDVQIRKISGIMNDCEMRIVPKYSPEGDVVFLNRQEGHTLVDAAQEGRCMICTEDCRSCKNCDLYKTLLSLVPLDSYESSLCPYNMQMKNWKD